MCQCGRLRLPQQRDRLADWPLYSYVAPLSWLVQSDVERGRDELNFSDWPEDADEADNAIDAILDGSMPPDRYTRIHRGRDSATARPTN